MEQTIKAILVDDEIDALENLRCLLELYCPKVKIVGEATCVDEAVETIKAQMPDVVFLDIEMPEKNGFHLLKEFSEINFHIIFVTAYDHYAIKAFQVAALDYLLKPVDIELLENAVDKIASVNTIDNSRLELLQDNKNEIKKIAIPFNKDYKIVDIRDVLCIEADRMYSNIYTASGKQYVAAKKLMYYEKLLKDNAFVRVHRSWLVNTNHIKSYSKINKTLGLSTSMKIPLSNGYKEELEHIFKI